MNSKPQKITDVELTTINGGRNLGTKGADRICNGIGNIWNDYVKLESPKYPCPKCGSWNVGNYDPGTLYQMRVYCKDCGFFGCRDGDDDELWGNEIELELYRSGVLIK